MVTGLAFVDFRKALDVINHELLLKKLSIYGANDLSLKWFGSYLSGRKQYVRIKAGFHMIANDPRRSRIVDRRSQTIAKRPVSGLKIGGRTVASGELKLTRATKS